MTDFLLPFSGSSGPKDARIAIVGEAWGETEALTGLPFVGSSGKELDRMLLESGIDRKACFLTNTFNVRPEGNKIEALCASKAEVGGSTYSWPPLRQGKYIRPQLLPHVSRLLAELAVVRPNVVVALGNTAIWAVLRATGIGSLRGAVAESVPLGRELGTPFRLKVLPTYHPSAVLRNWAWRPIAVVDLFKAAREAHFPEVRRPERFILVNPTIDELETWRDEMLGIGRPARMAVDIETKGRLITCIGFGYSRNHAVVVPFWSPYTIDYWPTRELEVRARRVCADVLRSSIPKVTQNGLYDIQYLLNEGYPLCAFDHDTMLAHHAVLPEMQKGLGFLGSVYTNEAAWKLMRKQDTTKRDE